MEPTLHISEMDRAAIDRACALQPADKWVRGRLYWHLITPYAMVLQAELNGEHVGHACATVYNDSGWVREVRVLHLRDDATVGPALLKELLARMEAAGATRQITVAPKRYQPLFAAFGFVPEGEVLEYECGQFLQATRDEVVNMEPEHILGVLHLDRLATGEDREQLIREHMYLGSVYIEGSRIRGFSLPLLGEGLIVADHPEAGLELQRWLFPIQPILHMPAGQLAGHEHLIKQGYSANYPSMRMVRGSRPAYRPAMIFAHP